MRSPHTLAAVVLALGTGACSTAPVQTTRPATWDDVQALPAASVGERIAYGPDAKQFGDLRVPAGRGPHPVAILLHGGCWQGEYDLAYFAHLGDQLAQAGIATWSLEYRGIGDAGGGWPGTFEDVAAGAAHLRTLAQSHPLDLDRVALVGHSAGGQLALHLAARWLAPSLQSPPAATPLPLRGVVTLAGIVDLRDYAAGSGSCNQSVVPLLGGTVDDVPERYAATSPIERLPIGVPLHLVIGTLDPIVTPASNTRFAEQARLNGDAVELDVIEGAGHFDLVMPEGVAAQRVRHAIQAMLRPGPK
ncbi:MAG: alpha/beta hydrolase family protein [Arenimonas sp.]